MARIDNILEDARKEVEIYGKSGGECVFLTNLTLTFSCENFVCPKNANLAGALADFDWFVLCQTKGYVVSHPAPDSSYWLQQFGEKALPYGYSWNFKLLRDSLTDSKRWRQGVLFNPQSYNNPPCITCYQFQQANYGTLDLTVTMRSSDVAKVLPQDVLMSQLLLSHVSNLVAMEPGNMTFNIGNAHVYWEDTEFQEEFTFDDGL
jgi:hypothetical protein